MQKVRVVVGGSVVLGRGEKELGNGQGERGEMGFCRQKQMVFRKGGNSVRERRGTEQIMLAEERKICRSHIVEQKGKGERGQH